MNKHNNPLHTRTNRLSKAEQKGWWAANSDALKGMSAEVQGVTTANVDSSGKARAPYKARNTFGYDLTEWYRGDWSHREAAGKSQGYEPKGLPATVTEVDNNGDLRTERTQADREKGARDTRLVMAAKGAPNVEPWQNHVTEPARNKGLVSAEPTWTDARGDLTLPTWQMVEVESQYNETDADRREAQRVLSMSQRSLYALTWTSDDTQGMARLLWTARLRYAKQSRSPEKGARVMEASFGWKSSKQDLWQAEREMRGELAVNSIDGAPNAADMEEEGQYGFTEDPMNEMAWTELLQMTMRTLTDKQREALCQRMYGKPVTDRHTLKAAQLKMQRGVA